MKSQQQEILSKYNYNREKPLQTSTNYNVYQGTIKQSGSSVTIKTFKYPHVELGGYLQKVKDCKSQNVIKIYELLVEQQFLVMVSEPVIFGNLRKALEICRYLDENDAIFISKQILNGHVDLLRLDLNWFGTQEDIQFAQDGQIRLSWNNSCSFNLVNPMPAILAKISTRSSQWGLNTILPFPMSKTLEQLLRISKQNASQIAMNPHMKKKDKITKRKGDNWIGLKQAKNNNQYFDQLSYFAVHSDYGFIRVKVYDEGKISPNLLQMSKTKPTFTKIYHIYNQNNKTIIISEYSNDGSIQSYLARLKTAGVKLKEEHIQYLVYSLFNPIKMVQQSTLKAVCMLHIKNIYIDFGIPKIGQPLPLNQKIVEVMNDRKEVPDFFHTDFKKDPNSREERFDMYSLGVLMYKLMYNDTIIFREPGVPQIPSVPSYSKKLKDALLQLLIGQKLNIRQIQQTLQISSQVKKVIEENKEKLKKGKQEKGIKSQDTHEKRENESDEERQPENQEEEQSSLDQQGNPKIQEEDEDDEGSNCCDSFQAKISLKDPKVIPTEERKAFVDHLELSSFKNFRLWSKGVVIVVLYIFLFYFKFIQNSIYMLASQGLLLKIDLTTKQGKNVSIIATDKFQFESIYNKTGQLMSDLQNMNCLIEDRMMTNKYSDFLKEDSYVWYAYFTAALASFLLIIIFKIIQIHLFDDINAWWRKQEGQGYFNISNWVLLNFHWLSLISGHYFLFNYAFQPQIQPCVGHKKGLIWGSTWSYFNDHSIFIAPHCVVFGVQLFILLCYLVLIHKNQQMTVKYNKIFNTLSIFGSILLVFWLIIRLGIILPSKYYPAALTDHQRIITKEITDLNYLLIFAIIPEFLFVMQIILLVVVNSLYYVFVDKSQKLLNDGVTVDVSLKDII